MNDDPTQLFPQTHWKRYATEPVSVPVRNLKQVIPQVSLAADLRLRAIPGKETPQLAKLSTVPLLS